MHGEHGPGSLEVALLDAAAPDHFFWSVAECSGSPDPHMSSGKFGSVGAWNETWQNTYLSSNIAAGKPYALEMARPSTARS